MVEVKRVRLGDIAYEYKERIGEEAPDRPVYGVDKSVGLTAEPRYQSSNLSRYKRIENCMFAYNPMRLNIGSIGFCHNDLLPGIVSPDYVVFGCREEVLLPKFMDYHTQSAPWSDWLSVAGEGSVRERVYFRKLETYELTLPSVSYQEATVEILSALDKKIELNRRMNDTLEALAQAIFKDWFVDFGHSCRKQNGAVDAVAILGGLIPNPAKASLFAALFPSSFSENGLPKGWELREIGQQAQVLGGSTPSTKEPIFWEPAEHCWVTPKDLSTHSDLALFETERKISGAGLARITSGLLPVGTVLLSSRAPIGYLAISQVPVAINQGFIALPPNESVGTAYLYLWCKANMEQIVANANGSTFQEISKRNFRPIKSAVPNDKRIIAAFAEIVNPLIARIVSAANENRTLVETRDYLLPKLMSGTVRVRDAEKAVP